MDGDDKIVTPAEQESLFQQHLLHWKEYADKSSWDGMWLRVYECCKAIAKSKCNGINNQHLEERALDGATYVMDLISRGNYPAKLSSVCYLQTMKFLYGNREKQADRELQLSVIQENYITNNSEEDLTNYD